MFFFKTGNLSKKLRSLILEQQNLHQKYLAEKQLKTRKLNPSKCIEDDTGKLCTKHRDHSFSFLWYEQGIQMDIKWTMI